MPLSVCPRISQKSLFTANWLISCNHIHGGAIINTTTTTSGGHTTVSIHAANWRLIVNKTHTGMTVVLTHSILTLSVKAIKTVVNTPFGVT